MSSSDLDGLEQPANAALCAHLRARCRADVPPLARAAEVARPYETLGAHPDLVARLWDEITTALPVDCRFVVFGAPALMRPDSGIVFGFAGGTHAYALRLPDDARAEALGAGAARVHHYPRHASFDLEAIGPEWVFCRWHEDEARWCLAAYRFASAGG
jgi:hypothetical protein